MVGMDHAAAVRTRRDGLSWPHAVGLVALAIPAAISLGAESWSNDAGSDGPLGIATSVWLVWRERPELQARGNPGSFWIVCGALVPALAMYIAGEAFDSITLEAFGLYVVVGMVFYALFGAREIARNWFIFVYLLFAVPPPRSWLDMAFFPLKQFVSSLEVTLLKLSGMLFCFFGF